MASYRRPKGVVTRHTADWLPLQTASVGGWFQAVATNRAPGFDLFNNDNQGGSLWVYKVIVGNDGDGIFFSTLVNGHGANFAQNAVPIVTGQALIPGQLYYDVYPGQANLINPGVLVSNALVLLNESAGDDHIEMPGPIAVITPGYSLRVQNQMVNTTAPEGTMFAVSFYYTYIPQIQ